MNSREYINNSLSTIIEMLNDRGIDTGLSPADAPNLVGWNINIFKLDIEKVRIIYYLPSKFKWADLKATFDTDKTHDLFIIIVKEKLTQNNIKLMNALQIPIQTFQIKELQFNITKHSLVPKHEIITNAEEIDNIVKLYSLKTKFQLPLLLRSDPIAKYYNLKNGDVVRIVRPSPTAAEYIVYRCCL
jgi:DNA-directed RNA polymerase subunit H (RpoH/RPB5)